MIIAGWFLLSTEENKSLQFTRYITLVEFIIVPSHPHLLGHAQPNTSHTLQGSAT